MATSLIFGVTSFTGRYVKHIFESHGHHVVGTVLSQKDVLQGSQNVMYPVDILDADAVAAVVKTVQPDYVIHLSGISFVLSNDTSQFYNVHILGTRNILKALFDHAPHVQKIVLASTAQVYGAAACPDEQSPICPLNDYAVSKVAMEHMSSLWCEWLPIVLARPFNCIGVGQSPNFLASKILRSFFAQDDTIELGNMKIERDFIDIRQAAKDYYTLAIKGQASEAYNIASGQSCSIARMIDLLSEISGHSIAIRHNPQFVRVNDPISIQGRVEKMTALFDNRPNLDLKDTLRWMYDDACRS